MDDTGAMLKADVVSEQLEDRYGVTLHDWVAHKIGRGSSWAQMALDLHAALGWDRRPMSGEGLRKWWQRNGRERTSA